MTDALVLEISRLEATHLSSLVEQFLELLDATDDARADPAVLRLVPDAYADDAEAAAEFRSLTERDLLARRHEDARIVTASLAPVAAVPGESDSVALVLDRGQALAWMRTLAAVRLVLASRLEITDEDDHDPEDPRYGVYEWLGFRLDGIVRSLDEQ